jgi:hypothetical protein
MVADQLIPPHQWWFDKRPTTGVRTTPTFTGARYNPRSSSAAENKPQWEVDISESMRRSKIPTSTLLQTPPTKSDIRVAQPNLSNESVDAAFAALLADYQLVNTDVWDVVHPSVIIDGAHAVADREHIARNYMIGDLRDGCGLYRWILSLEDSSSVASQLPSYDSLVN